jgi:polyhydroxyalkanoate synthase
VTENSTPDPELLKEYQKFASFVASSSELKAMREEVRSRIAPTPRDELYREHSVTVYRYRRRLAPSVATPLLIVPSLVNKPFIMDLLEGESFVAAMLERGFDVFMVEWGDPTPGQRRLGLGYYVENYLGRAVRRTMRAAGASGVSLAGYCLGGSVALLHAAGDGGEFVKNLVMMVAPVNFEDRGLLSWWSREEHFDVDRVVDTYGNIPADFFSSSFPWLVPTGTLVKIRTIYERHQDRRFMESFLALDIWATENTPFPGEVYREIIKNGYQRNVLVKDRAWNLGARTAKLCDVRMGVLSMAARFDHIVPFESCSVLSELVGSEDCTCRTVDAGHLGIALGKEFSGKATTAYWDEISDWLARRS